MFRTNEPKIVGGKPRYLYFMAVTTTFLLLKNGNKVFLFQEACLTALIIQHALLPLIPPLIPKMYIFQFKHKAIVMSFLN